VLALGAELDLDLVAELAGDLPFRVHELHRASTDEAERSTPGGPPHIES